VREPVTVLIDENVRSRGITHRWATEEKTVQWSAIKVSAPVHGVREKTLYGWDGEQAEAVRRLADLMRAGRVEYLSTFEIKMEAAHRRLPASRYAPPFRA